MKGKILFSGMLLCVSMALSAETPEQAAYNSAQAACGAFGQRAVPTTQSQSHGSVSYSSTSSTENRGSQNQYSGQANAGVATGALSSAIVSGNAGAGASVTRTGSQTNTGSQNQSSGTLYYKCEPKKN